MHNFWILDVQIFTFHLRIWEKHQGKIIRALMNWSSAHFQLKLIYETVSLYDCFYWPSWRLEFMTVAAHLLFLLNFRDSIDNLSPVETSFSI